MSLPDILPTGAMPSGTYVDYMIGYLNNACDSLIDQIQYGVGLDTIEDWKNQWNLTINDISSSVDELEADVNTVRIKSKIINDKLSKM
jgi:hypothetical protein